MKDQITRSVLAKFKIKIILGTIVFGFPSVQFIETLWGPLEPIQSGSKACDGVTSFRLVEVSLESWRLQNSIDIG